MNSTALLGFAIVGLAVFFGFHLDGRLGRSIRPRRRVRPSDLRPPARAQPQCEPQRLAAGS